MEADDICEIYKSLKEFCKEKSFEIVTPKSGETSFFRTIAICKKEKYKHFKYRKEFPLYKNRIIFLSNNSQDTVIIGCHAPSKGKIDTYWASLICICRDLIAESRKIIIIGDLNVYMPRKTQKKKFYSLLSEGMVDLWIEKGIQILIQHISKVADSIML